MGRFKDEAMAFQAIAYGPDELSLLTLDGCELLAHDAESERPTWRRTFDRPLAAAAFVDPRALPRSPNANPWRTLSTARAIVAVDVEGRMHILDPTLGQPIGELGPFGKPFGLIASTTTGTVALALEQKVVVWKEGSSHEIPCRARAIAFSRDGATLATASDKSAIRMFDVGGSGAPRESFSCSVKGAIVDLAEHPTDGWLAAGTQGAFLVGVKGSARLDKVSDGVQRIGIDASGGRLVVQRSESALVVYEWPSLAVLLRVEYVDRPIRGIAFGPESWLGVALDLGDANKIDMLTATTKRTETHPGRQHRSWSLLVEGRRKAPSGDEGASAPRPEAPGKTASTMGPRIGLGALASIALIFVRLCTRTAAPNPTFSYENAEFKGGAGLLACDKACVEDRLRELQMGCGSSECASEARAALTAFAEGNCEDATDALDNIPRQHPSADGGTSNVLFETSLLRAQLGLHAECPSEAVATRATIKHAKLVHLSGSELTEAVESIPEASALSGEAPQSVWAAPDGTVFVATTSTIDGVAGEKYSIYRRTTSGDWKAIYDQVRTAGGATLFGRTSSDLYVETTYAIDHFDGNAWKAVTPVGNVDPIYVSGTSTDTFFAKSELSGTPQVERVRGDVRTKEAFPPKLDVTGLFGGPSSIWATADDASARPVLLQRSAAGTWAIKTPAGRDAEAPGVSSAWVSPDGDAFFSMGNVVHRSSKGAWLSAPAPAAFHRMWGRSSSDVYGASVSGLFHYDGKSWSATSYKGKVSDIGGTASEVLVLRRD